MIASEASAVEVVVLVAGNSVVAVMVTEIVAVEEAIAGTDLALEELVGTDAAVVRIPCSVVVWGTVADAVVSLVPVAWTAEIAVEAVIIGGPGVVVVVVFVGTVKFVGKSVVVEIGIEAGVDAAYVALPMAHFEAEWAVEVLFGLMQAGGTVAGNVLVVVVVVVPGTVAAVVETVAEVATVAGVAMVVETAWVAEALMAAEDEEISEAVMAVGDAEVVEDAMAPEDAEVAEVAAAAEESEVAEAVMAAEDVEIAEAVMAVEDAQVAEVSAAAEAARVVEVVNFVEDVCVVELALETGTAGFASSVKVVDLAQTEGFVTLNSMELAAGTSEVTQPG